MSRAKLTLLCCAAFIAVFAIRYALFEQLGVMDAGVWEYMAQKVASSPWPVDVFGLSTGFPDPVYLYPGTTIALPAAGLILLGFDAHISLQLVLAALIALCVCRTVMLARELRPDTTWLASVLLLLALSPFYINAVPPSALASALAPLVVIYALLALKDAQAMSTARLFSWGVVLGLLCATRLDIGAVLSLACGSGALYAYRRRSATFFIGAAVAFFAANPFALAGIDYFGTILSMVFAHFAHDSYELQTVIAPLFVIVSESALALLGVFLAMTAILGSLIERRKSVFFAAALALTTVVLLLYFSSRFQAIWYLYPIIAAWNIFALYLLMEFMDTFSLVRPRATSHVRTVILSAVFLFQIVPLCVQLL